ncbi:MAG: hypothetical protein ACPGJS_08965 [Flammeovirgaceae bacterium]
MPKYQLNIDFESSDLKTIAQAGEQVILMKQTDGGTPVAWVSIDPFNNNTVEWEENYALYASMTEVQNGATIHKLSDTEAKPMVVYPFTSYGAMGTAKADSSLTQGQYAVVNNYEKTDILTFGLAQGVQVNGTGYAYKPLNAQPVPKRQGATFIPLTEVVVFLDAKLEDGMVITEVRSRATTLTFGGNITDITVKYDSNSGLFVAA